MVDREFSDGTRLIITEHPTGESEVILQLDGKQVSRTVIIPMFMRLGAGVVRMDGIGGVGTEEEYRNRGYSRRVMEHCVEIMRSGDAAISTLYGISDFYPKFGYAMAGPENTVGLPIPEDLSEIAPLPSGWKFRPFTTDDLPAVKRIYHESTRRSTGALVRHPEPDESPCNQTFLESSAQSTKIGHRAWDKMKRSTHAKSKDECRVLVNPSGEIVAYAWLAMIENWWMFVRRRDFPNAFHFAEIMASNPTAADIVLSACLRWAKQASPSSERIDIAIPPEGLVFSAVSYEGGMVLQINERRGDFMSRTLDTERLLRQMQPEFESLIRSSNTGFNGQLTFETNEGNGSLFITPDGVTLEPTEVEQHIVVDLDPGTLGQLCLGAYETGDVLARLPNPPDEKATSLLETLFPRRYPHIYPLDRF